MLSASKDVVFSHELWTDVTAFPPPDVETLLCLKRIKNYFKMILTVRLLWGCDS